MSRKNGVGLADEKRLNAYLDGELDAAERQQLEESLAVSGALRERLARMEQGDTLVRAAGSRLADDEVPDRFLSAIDGCAPAGSERLPAATNDNSVTGLRVGTAIAASLVLGLLAGSQIPRSSTDALVSPALARSLERTASGDSVTLAAGARMEPQLTFPNRNGGYCRQFRLDSATRALVGLACRDADNWNMEAVVPVTPVASAEDGYVVAEGPGGNGLEPTIANVRGGDPLAAVAESRLIENNWQMPEM